MVLDHNIYIYTCMIMIRCIGRTSAVLRPLSTPHLLWLRETQEAGEPLYLAQASKLYH